MWLNTITMLLLGWLTVSDFRYRRVWTLNLALIAVMIWVKSVSERGIEMVLPDTVINIILLAFLVGCVAVYMKARYGRRFRIGGGIGLGDIVFLAVLTPSLSPLQYFLFMLGSFIGALVWWAVIRWLRGDTVTIPLVGILSVFYAAIIIRNLLNPVYYGS